MIVDKIKQYFDVRELVDPHTYATHRGDSWQFLCPLMLENLLFMREAIGRPFYANDWYLDGGFSQRGLRSNLTPLVKNKTERGQLYLSAHTMGKAVDFTVKGMHATKVREWAVQNAEAFPNQVRFENLLKGEPIGWVHMDVYQNPRNGKLTLFNV